MNKMYVIQWKSKVNGRAGRGTKLFEREDAEHLVEELNSEYPDIEHQMVESDLRSDAATAAADPDARRMEAEEAPAANPQPPILSLKE